jgi:uncharacterized membrane protein
MIDWFLSSINELSVAFLVIASLMFTIVRKIKKKKIAFEQMLAPALAAGTLPTGIALIVCAFSPNYANKLESLGMHLAVAGLALLFLAFHEMAKGLK